jgi:hypothetical protein
MKLDEVLVDLGHQGDGLLLPREVLHFVVSPIRANHTKCVLWALHGSIDEGCTNPDCCDWKHC